MCLTFQCQSRLNSYLHTYYKMVKLWKNSLLKRVKYFFFPLIESFLNDKIKYER